MNTREKASLRREKEPARLEQASGRGTASPGRGTDSPDRKTATLEREEASLRRETVSPGRDDASPRRKTTSPGREEATPRRETGSLEWHDASLRRETASPGRDEAPPRRVAFKTLGCKLNQAETESIATGFKALGWELAGFGEAADATVINSCTVTNTADRKSRSAMNQALRFAGGDGSSAGSAPNPTGDTTSPAGGSRSPAGIVVMTGCYVDGHRNALEADGRTFVVGNDRKAHIPQLVDAHFRGELLSGHIEGERDPFGFPLAEKVFRTRAMVKIQDGCDNFCTYCIIPFVRGRGISRRLTDVVKAVEDAALSGFREIVLTGVNMSRWEEDGRGFADLVAACLDAKGDFRLRLGSVEPDRIDDALLELMDHPKMTPHMHLCLQSGSEKVLLAMRRQYTAAEFEEIAARLRTRVPGFNITTDIITGFPGESEEEFEETLDRCRRLAFGHIHTFPYSRREGTRADRMDGQVPGDVKKRRSEAVRLLSEETKRAYRESLIGSFQEVLVEKAEREADGTLSARGLSAPYVPVRFALPGTRDPEDVQNCIFRVKLTGIDSGDDPDLVGEPRPLLP